MDISPPVPLVFHDKNAQINSSAVIMVSVFLASYPTRNDLGILTDMATLIRTYHDYIISLWIVSSVVDCRNELNGLVGNF